MVHIKKKIKKRKEILKKKKKITPKKEACRSSLRPTSSWTKEPGRHSPWGHRRVKRDLRTKQQLAQRLECNTKQREFGFYKPRLKFSSFRESLKRWVLKRKHPSTVLGEIMQARY